MMTKFGKKTTVEYKFICFFTKGTLEKKGNVVPDTHARKVL